MISFAPNGMLKPLNAAGAAVVVAVVDLRYEIAVDI